MDGTRRSDVALEAGSRGSLGSGTPTRSAPTTPPSSMSTPQTAATPVPKSSRTLLSKLSMAPPDANAFGREAECGVCTKSFNLLRRRHHCRGCNVAVCKECGHKAIDHRKGERSKPQWYCDLCIESDDAIEVTGSRPTLHKRMSFSAPSYSPSRPPVSSVRFHASIDYCLYFC